MLTLIATVGTSLIKGNIEPLIHKEDASPKLKKIIDAYKQQRWDAVADAISMFEPSERLCGAEINTVFELMRVQHRPIEKIFFLVSDTEEGVVTGKILS